MAQELKRVTRIAINGLFGVYNHEVKLSGDSRITILHGPNGVGKTLLLKSVAAFFRGRFMTLSKVPFSTFSVCLGDDVEITVRRSNTDNESGTLPAVKRGDKLDLAVEIRNGKEKQQHTLKTRSADIDQVARRLERETPWISQISDSVWLDRRSGTQMDSEELVRSYFNERNTPSRMEKLLAAEPEPLRKLRESVSVHFIETNRLMRMRTDEEWSMSVQHVTFDAPIPKPSYAVDECAADLKRRIDTAMAQYGRESQLLDQSFPQRLLTEQVPLLPTDQLQHKLEELELTQKRLSDIGLLAAPTARPVDPASLSKLEESKKGPMTLYVLDNEKKLDLFRALTDRIQLLLESINRKFRNKQVHISRERGLAVTTSSGQALSLEALSSGEQHEIVLLYDLLFRIRQNSLVLIDEPELSLHVTWQKQFLPELLSVVKTAGFDVIMATHSPFIVGDRIDLMVPLDAEPDQEQAQITK